MSDQSPPSIWERSPLVRFFHWLFSWRGIRRILIVLAWVVTIVALLYGEENWRGQRAWNKYRRQLEARGEQLDFKAFIPKPVPDEQNFAATPLVKSWFPRSSPKWEDNYNQISGKLSSSEVRPDRGNRHFINLVAWKMGFDAIGSGELKKVFSSDKLDRQSRAEAAPGVLRGLKDSDAKLEELRAASRHPYARYPVEYKLDDPWGILLPHLAGMKGICQRLQLRACAQLAAGRPAEALEDVKLILYLADSLKEEPLLISYLVRLACVQIAIQPIWEGLAEHRWSDAQLQELQTRLQRYDFVADMEFPLDAERAAGILTADLLYKRKYRLSQLIDDQTFGGTMADVVARIAPRGWYHQEKLNYTRLYDVQQKQLVTGAGESQRHISPTDVRAGVSELERQLEGSAGDNKRFEAVFRHRVLAALLLPALSNVSRRAAMGQIAADEAAIACALERYRLAHGEFPEKLEALVPQFISRIPNDVLSGEPYKYRRTDDGQFVLYSAGWNEKDDGGVPGERLNDEKQGDWVWQYGRK